MGSALVAQPLRTGWGRRRTQIVAGAVIRNVGERQGDEPLKRVANAVDDLAVLPSALLTPDGRLVDSVVAGVNLTCDLLAVAMRPPMQMPFGPRPSAQTRRLDRPPSASMSNPVRRPAKDSQMTTIRIRAQDLLDDVVQASTTVPRSPDTPAEVPIAVEVHGPHPPAGP